ncbi:MAG: serine/threonine protein kinase [Bdellovibrionales bacterium]|nr:serine/threonine protein kinase [Bdellovibrionales bacterium]
MSFSDNFYQLDIQQVMRVCQECGFDPTGEYFQLNSYENRVFDIFLESEELPRPHVIAKVYRPHRWSEEAIAEEHLFLEELKTQGVPAVAPLKLPNGKTTWVDGGMIFSFFPKARGRMPQELSLEEYRQVGIQLAKLHNVGAQSQAQFRPTLNVDEFGWSSLQNLKSWVAPEVWPRYQKAAQDIFEFLEDHLSTTEFIRIHGDCHKGNILQTDPKEGEKEIFFVDFDDFVNGPVVQDFWMLFSGDDEQGDEELESFLSGYESLRLFDESQLEWMHALRGLRIVYYANWIARRWRDPSFPKMFPDFRDYTYWAEEVEALERLAWSL